MTPRERLIDLLRFTDGMTRHDEVADYLISKRGEMLAIFGMIALEEHEVQK